MSRAYTRAKRDRKIDISDFSSRQRWSVAVFDRVLVRPAGEETTFAKRCERSLCVLACGQADRFSDSGIALETVGMVESTSATLSI